MGGELCINVKLVKSDNHFVKPFNSNNPSNDLTMVDEDGKYLHICGNNDWAYFAAELLKPVLKTGQELYSEIFTKVSKDNPEVVLVGRNEFRLLDIVQTVRDLEQGAPVIMGVPVVKGNFANGIKYLGKMETEECLPF